jgi:hypothetical protein
VVGLRQARALAEENGHLKHLVEDLTVQIDLLKAINAKNSAPGQQATDGTIGHAKRLFPINKPPDQHGHMSNFEPSTTIAFC